MPIPRSILLGLLGLIQTALFHTSHAQIGRRSGLDLYAQFDGSFRREDPSDPKSYADVTSNRTLAFGVGYYLGLNPHAGLSLETGFQSQTMAYQYRTLYNPDISADFSAQSIQVRPAVVVSLARKGGFFLRLAIPVVIKVAAQGRLITYGYRNGQNLYQDLSADINTYRTTAFAAVELGIGYLIPVGQQNGIWIRGNLGYSVSQYWNARYQFLAEHPGYTTLGIALGFRFGSTKQAFDPVQHSDDPANPSLRKRMKDQAWIND